MMPEMNGLEVTRRLKELRPNLPVLFMSGYPKDAIPDRNIAHADIDLIAKPFTVEELCGRVRRVLDGVRKA